MPVEIAKVTVDRCSVSVDGALVGGIQCVHLEERPCGNDYADDFLRGGSRWLPKGVDPLI